MGFRFSLGFGTRKMHPGCRVDPLSGGRFDYHAFRAASVDLAVAYTASHAIASRIHTAGRFFGHGRGAGRRRPTGSHATPTTSGQGVLGPATGVASPSRIGRVSATTPVLAAAAVLVTVILMPGTVKGAGGAVSGPGARRG